MKEYEEDLVVLSRFDDKVSSLLQDAKTAVIALETTDISVFVNGLEDLYTNDFLPILKQCRQTAESAPSTAFSDKYDYLSRT